MRILLGVSHSTFVEISIIMPICHGGKRPRIRHLFASVQKQDSNLLQRMELWPSVRFLLAHEDRIDTDIRS